MSSQIFVSTLTGLMFVVAPGFAQAPAASKAAAVKTNPAAAAIPRTADGHPDLSGVYSNSTAVPLARPAGCGDKEFYTPEEAAAGARGCAAAGGRGGRGAGGGGAAAAAGGAVHYDMAQFGLDASHTVRAPSLRTSILTGPEGVIPPITPEAKKRNDARAAFNRVHQWDGAETRPLGERCLLWPNEGPPFMPTGYDSDLQIAQGEGYVAIDLETIHDVRIVPTDGRPHVASNVRLWLGDSKGHWEGDTLVIETTNFNDRTLLQGSLTSPLLKVTERLSMIDAKTARYQFTVDDPGTWTKPWSGEYSMVKIDSPMFEYACHEGNYGLPNNISGNRATEKE